MKYLYLILLLLTNGFVFSQNNCSCKDEPDLKEIIYCDTLIFNNYSKLYRQFNCDSSWLTFEKSNGVKNIIYSLDKDMLYLTYKLGYQFIAEFDSFLFFQNRKISGCCFPIPYIFLDKTTGKVIEEIDHVIDYNVEEFDFLVYITDTALNSITLRYFDSGKKYMLLIPDNRIEETILQSDEIYPEFLFKLGNITDSVYSISYSYQIPSNTEDWFNDKIVLDLREYRP